MLTSAQAERIDAFVCCISWCQNANQPSVATLRGWGDWSYASSASALCVRSDVELWLGIMKKLAFLILLSQGCFAGQCITYTNTEISGTLYRQTFAGPPNYESVAAGDIAETYFLLKLAKPTCVSGGRPENDFEENYAAVSNVLLALTGPSAFESLRPLLGKVITCTGSLFSAHTGHHHTEVLLSEASCR